MKLIYSLLLCVTVNLASIHAQIGIGTTSPKAALEIVSTDTGILIPRVSLTSLLVQAPVINPQPGALVESTLVYNTATVGIAPNNVVPGFYYWNGSKWVALAGGGTAPTSSNAWLLTGNAGTNTTDNFVGTTDAAELHIRTNGSNKFRISSGTAPTQMFGYGGTESSPTYSWDGYGNTGIYVGRQGTGNQILFSTGSTQTPAAGIARLKIPNANQVHAMDRGTAALPFYSFSADANTGLYSPGVDQLSITKNK